MSEPIVTSVSVEELLGKLRGREWLMPQFQREFVWTIQDVIDLTHSILFSRPIGMATLWAQADDSQLQLEPISLPDIGQANENLKLEFSDAQNNPKKIYAILDGRQRCTAVAMVFGGFHSKDSRLRLSGRYFLKVAEEDPAKQVVFYKENEILHKGFDKEATCISSGLFPLWTEMARETLLGQWMRYVQAVKDPKYYSDGRLPDPRELERRDAILKKAFDGIIKTRLAVYIVPEAYSLAEVCEIFETLNVTGTKVSTVDLVHSWLYADTASDAKQIHLRDWIGELRQKDGAFGWASPDERPELTVQMATACYVALDDRPKPRPIRKAPGKEPDEILSVKADDLLRTPTQHWKNVIGNDGLIAEFLGDFQRCVAGGYFPWTDCPYPVSAAIYVALRFHFFSDAPANHRWSREDLDGLFRAFFWRNALTNRYDQGVGGQLGIDLREIKSWLKESYGAKSHAEWAANVDGHLNRLLGRPLPTRERLIDWLTDDVAPGALGKALTLPMVAGANEDLLDEDARISFPTAERGVQLHHIYPKAWCQSNKVGALAVLLDAKKAGRDWVNSVANLMPLSRQSNNLWKAKQPGQVLSERNIDYDKRRVVLQSCFIDKQCFDYLLQGDHYLKEFWERRAGLLADHLLDRMRIVM